MLFETVGLGTITKGGRQEIEVQGLNPGGFPPRTSQQMRLRGMTVKVEESQEHGAWSESQGGILMRRE